MNEGCVQKKNIEKQRRHLRTIEWFEEIAATDGSGAARGLCNNVSIGQTVLEPRGGMMIRTAIDLDVSPEGIRPVQKIVVAVSRPAGAEVTGCISLEGADSL